MKTIHTRNNTFPAQQLKGKYCLSPFVQVNIDSNGVGICGCRSWQPTVIGNIFENSLEELLAGPTAQNIRKSIIDGTYTYCHPTRCGILRSGNLNDYDSLPLEIKQSVDEEDPTRFSMPHHIVIALDNTCNLFCPSCRHRVIKNNDEIQKKQQELAKKLTKNLFGTPTDQKIELTLDTSGEVFASPLLLDFLSNISTKDFPNLEIDLLSNGLLAQDRWHRLGDMQNHVTRITVSYDSPDPVTYEKLRRGGEWNNLVKSLTWLKHKKKENGMAFKVRMVVQKDNYKQMKQFYEFSQRFDVDEVQFQRIVNWSTFTTEQFLEVDIFNETSDHYNDALECLKEVNHLKNTVFWHGIPKI
jgi:MoaA/NifB/PqqE/SkfB family radical SAM enzyme